MLRDIIIPSLSLWVLIWLVSSFLYNLITGG
jgi:hypothetical protein